MLKMGQLFTRQHDFTQKEILPRNPDFLRLCTRLKFCHLIELNVGQMMECVIEQIEGTVGEEDKTGYQFFCSFFMVFIKKFSCRVVK